MLWFPSVQSHIGFALNLTLHDPIELNYKFITEISRDLFGFYKRM